MKKVKLGEVCEVLNGFAFKSLLYVNEGIRIIRITNVQKGYIEDSDPKYYPIEYRNSIEKYILKENDLLMSLTGNVGRVGLISKTMLPAALNQRVACLRTIDSLISKEYVFQFLNSDLFEQLAIRSSNGVAQKNLSTDWLKKVEITYPSVEQQKLITSTLNLIERLICCRKEQNKKLNELVKSRFNEMFGDIFDNPQSKLEDHIELNPNKKELLNFNGNVSFLPMSNVSENGKIDLSINRNIDDVRKGFTFFKDNDVIVAKITPCFENGKGAPVFGLLNGVGFGSTEFHVLRPKNTVNTVWLYHVTMLSKFRLEGERKMTGSGGQRRITKDFIYNFKLNIPPLALQNEFADFVAQVDKSQLAIQKSLEELETLKKSLMQEYFG